MAALFFFLSFFFQGTFFLGDFLVLLKYRIMGRQLALVLVFPLCGGQVLTKRIIIFQIKRKKFKIKNFVYL